MILWFPLAPPALGNLHVFWGSGKGVAMEDHSNTVPGRRWHRRLGARFTFLVWMGSFSVSIRKPHDQSNLGEKGFILAYISETESFMVGKAW